MPLFLQPSLQLSSADQGSSSFLAFDSGFTILPPSHLRGVITQSSPIISTFHPTIYSGHSLVPFKAQTQSPSPPFHLNSNPPRASTLRISLVRQTLTRHISFICLFFFSSASIIKSEFVLNLILSSRSSTRSHFRSSLFESSSRLPRNASNDPQTHPLSLTRIDSIHSFHPYISLPSAAFQPWFVSLPALLSLRILVADRPFSLLFSCIQPRSLLCSFLGSLHLPLLFSLLSVRASFSSSVYSSLLFNVAPSSRPTSLTLFVSLRSVVLYFSLLFLMVWWDLFMVVSRTSTSTLFLGSERERDGERE